ncbi:MAG TPA: hypothetical protein VFL57_13260 [Bryobacteraceae bacterium]|nr:hypothetical protein [Bryobacteraceae bacterium]
MSLAPNPFNLSGGVVKAAAAAAPVANPVSAPQAPTAPIDVLKNKLDEMGINSSGLQFTETRTAVGYPGGFYVNHLITVDFGAGVTESYDVASTLRNPLLTALEIDRLRRSRA